MHRAIPFLLCALLFPLFAQAEPGFARGSLWTSKTTITEGEPVTLFASVVNTSDVLLSGSIAFFDGEEKLGEAAVELKSGESRVASHPWTPSAGTHALRAVFSDATQEIDRTSLTVFVNERPKESVLQAETQSAAAVEGSEAIQRTITSIAPPAASYVNPAFETTDALREKGVGLLDEQIVKTQSGLNEIRTKKQAIDAGRPAGEDLPPAQEKERRTLSIKEIFQTLLLYVLETMRFIIASVAIFYPLMVALVFMAALKLYRRIRRPAY